MHKNVIDKRVAGVVTFFWSLKKLIMKKYIVSAAVLFLWSGVSVLAQFDDGLIHTQGPGNGAPDVGATIGLLSLGLMGLAFVSRKLK